MATSPNAFDLDLFTTFRDMAVPCGKCIAWGHKDHAGPCGDTFIPVRELMRALRDARESGRWTAYRKAMED